LSENWHAIVIERPADRGSAHLASVSRPGNRVAARNRPSPRHFESESGSIPVGTLWRLERQGACPAAGEPAVLFLPANTARLLVGISVGIGNNRWQKLVLIQIVMVLIGCRPGAPKAFSPCH
jgi:hypothetical protein